MPVESQVVLCIALLAFCVGCDSTPAQRVADNEGHTVSRPPQTSGSRAKYEGRLIRLEGVGEETAKVYFVEGGKRHWVSSIEWIKRRGFKWPEDVQAIPRQELEALPLGPPIMTEN